MFKRGQAAMEFLMTYGWAILVVLIALGALFYLGVFSPKTGNTYTIAAPFAGQDLKVTATTVTLKVGGSGISSARVTGADVGDAAAFTPSETNFEVDDVASTTCDDAPDDDDLCGVLTDVDSKAVTIDLIYAADTFTVGEKVAGTIDVTYTLTGGIEHTTTWDISGTVE